MVHGHEDFRYSTYVQTLAADNIVIDKLTARAVTEERRYIQNHGKTASWTTRIGDQRYGKYFSRGCRGYLEGVDVYCKNVGTVDGTITIWVSPHPNMGPLKSKTVTIPAGQPAKWVGFELDIFWNFDSLFIYLVASTTDIKIGYDTEEPVDTWYSDDAAATWSSLLMRLWSRAVLRCQTPGDLPVSGVLNVVEVPAFISSVYQAVEIITTKTRKTVFDIDGCGELIFFQFYASHDVDVCFRFTVDDKYIYFYAAEWVYAGLFENHGKATPGVQMILYTAGGDCLLQVTFPIPFKRKFKVEVQNTSATIDHKYLMSMLLKILG